MEYNIYDLMNGLQDDSVPLPRTTPPASAGSRS